MVNGRISRPMVLRQKEHTGSKTINIGSIEVPAPAIDKGEIYKRYYVPNMLVDRKYSICVWSNKKRDFDFLRNGMVHATKEGAVKHADALISLTYK